MTANGWFQIFFFFAVVLALTKPMGIFMARVFTFKKTFLDRILVPVENLIYRLTARNFNPIMATAARTTIVEVEELVQPGELDANCIVTPGIYVDRIVKLARVDKRIEQRTVRPRAAAQA